MQRSNHVSQTVQRNGRSQTYLRGWIESALGYTRDIEEVTKQVCKGTIEEQVEAAAQIGIARLKLNNKIRKEKREIKGGV